MTGWTHPFGPLGTPLVERDLSEPVIAAWLDHVARDAHLPKLMLLPYVPEDGAWARAFGNVIDRRSGRMKSFGRHARAMLAPGDARAIIWSTRSAERSARSCAANASGWPIGAC